jgi:hypothetical protein
MVSPSALAVLRLMTNSNVVVGRPAGLATDSHEARPIADQAAGRGEFTELIDRWNGKV